MKELWKVIVIRPSEEPEVKEIPAKLKALQDLVGGYIETVRPFEEQHVIMLVNEEGKNKGLALNRAIYDWSGDGDILDVIAGPIIILGEEFTEDGDLDFCSLTDDQVVKYTKMFRVPETFVRSGNKIVVVKKQEPVVSDPFMVKKHKNSLWVHGAFLEKPADDPSVTKEEVTALIEKVAGRVHLTPYIFESDKVPSIVYGFIDSRYAEMLDNNLEGFKKGLLPIVEDMELEDESGYYDFFVDELHRVCVWMGRNV